MATILIVEDEFAVARGIQYALQQEGYEVTIARSGEEGLEFATNQAPDLIVLDVRLPGIDGFEVLRRLRAVGSKAPVLFLTARGDEFDKVVGLELGADDYVTKPFALRELMSRIRALLRRAYGDLANASGGRVIRHGDLVIDLERRRVQRGNRRIALTATEFEILRHLASRPGRVFSRRELLELLRDYEALDQDEKTINVHVSHLRDKIEDDPSTPAVRAHGPGRRLPVRRALTWPTSDRRTRPHGARAPAAASLTRWPTATVAPPDGPAVVPDPADDRVHRRRRADARPRRRRSSSTGSTTTSGSRRSRACWSAPRRRRAIIDQFLETQLGGAGVVAHGRRPAGAQPGRSRALLDQGLLTLVADNVAQADVPLEFGPATQDTDGTLVPDPGQGPRLRGPPRHRARPGPGAGPADRPRRGSTFGDRQPQRRLGHGGHAVEPVHEPGEHAGRRSPACCS